MSKIFSEYGKPNVINRGNILEIIKVNIKNIFAFLFIFILNKKITKEIINKNSKPKKGITSFPLAKHK